MGQPRGRTVVSVVCDGDGETGRVDCCVDVRVGSGKKLDGSEQVLRSFLTGGACDKNRERKSVTDGKASKTERSVR